MTAQDIEAVATVIADVLDGVTKGYNIEPARKIVTDLAARYPVFTPAL
ncbi:hypothetical protein ACN28C_19440 [Plantactinospora sp. WMMC1484]